MESINFLTKEEVMALLEAQGRKTMECDTLVPFYDVPVPCGNSQDLADLMCGYKALPRELVKDITAVVTYAKGDSMKDAGILDGDLLLIDRTVRYHDRDIVLASLDGENLIKAYCEDENGQKWLVPKNEAFNAIKLDESMNPKIVGVVKMVIREAPHISYQDCMRIINRTKRAMIRQRTATTQQVELAIRNADEMVESGSQWFAVWRALVGKDEENGIKMDDFCRRVATLLPEHQHLPALRNVQRMDVQSFTKPVEEWREDNAPVRGNRFKAYKRIGLLTLELLEKTSAK